MLGPVLWWKVASKAVAGSRLFSFLRTAHKIRLFRTLAASYCGTALLKDADGEANLLLRPGSVAGPFKRFC